MDEDGCMGIFVGAIVVVALVGILLYFLAIAISAIAGVFAVAGTAWGGGTSVLNYVKAFKDNVKAEVT